MQDDDKIFMDEALKEAQKAFDAKEVPIGAVLVHENKIIARAHNLVEQMSDASNHAEVCCLRQAAALLKNWRLTGATLYCTVEPCSMCAGAMLLFRIKRVVYGAPDLRHGADGTVFDVLNRHHPIHNIEVVKGVCAQESAELLKKFFQERRDDRAIR